MVEVITLQADSKQDAFNKVVAHVRSMKSQAINAGSNLLEVCMYRTEDGKRCAIGALISDDDYHPSIEGNNVRTLIAQDKIEQPSWCELNFLTSLQSIHDYTGNWKVHFIGEAHVQHIAETFNLEVPS